MEKEEAKLVLELSYVLSKELGFQLYRATAAGQGKDANKEREAGTYGNDICFPGNMQVTMADGSVRDLSGVKAGDEMVTGDPVTLAATRHRREELTAHEAKSDAITRGVWLGASGRS